MDRNDGLIVCDACGRRYHFNARYAGQRVRCLCKAELQYPAAPPVPPAPAEPATPPDPPTPPKPPASAVRPVPSATPARRIPPVRGKAAAPPKPPVPPVPPVPPAPPDPIPVLEPITPDAADEEPRHAPREATPATPQPPPDRDDIYELATPDSAKPPAPSVLVTPRREAAANEPAARTVPPWEQEASEVDDEEEGDVEDDADGPVGFGRRIVMMLGQFMPGVFSPVVVVMSSICALIAAGLLVYAGWAGTEGEIQGSVIFIALATVIHAQGMVWIVTGRVDLITESIVDMDGLWGTFLGLTGVPIMGGIGVIYLVAAGMG